MVVHTYNFSTGEAEAGRPQVSLGYVGRFSLKPQTNKQTNTGNLFIIGKMMGEKLKHWQGHLTIKLGDKNLSKSYSELSFLLDLDLAIILEFI